MPEILRRQSNYTTESVGVGIVHLGLGAFHRAHQAAYIERWLANNGGGDWGICAANIRSNSTLIDQLTAQEHRFFIAEYSDREHVALGEIRSIRRALFAGEDKQELLNAMTAPATKIVSLTVTEKGYYLNPVSGALLEREADVVHDLTHPGSPRTAPGLVAEALRVRRASGIDPFTVLSCDNMPANGDRMQRAVCTIAEHNSAELSRWIERHVAFPSCMVDRIVPAVSSEIAGKLEKLLGFSDPAAVACEAYSKWVIEDTFSAGRPDWESVGVEMVDDVSTHETLKLRLLNGAHSLLAYAGLLRGKATVAEAISDPDLGALLADYFEEAAASLPNVPELSLKAYSNALIVRFRNDALEHRLTQIAMDGSQKIPQRWLDGLAINLAQGRAVSATTRAVAAWMAYVSGKDQSGNTWQVDDPLAVRLADCHRTQLSADDVVDSLLNIGEIFSKQLPGNSAFRDTLVSAFRDEISRQAHV